MAEAKHNARQLATVQAYHERTKHQLKAYAAGPDTLDWDAQPDPFRRYSGAPLTPLPFQADRLQTPWADLFEPGAVAPHPFSREAIGLLFELSFALSAWKQFGPDRWAMRVNPSSGNLHPTEAWLVCQGVAQGNDGVHHYAPREHALEQRATCTPQANAPGLTASAWVALTSTQACNTPFNWPAPSQWHGIANRLDPHPMYRWPVIDTVATATRSYDIILIANNLYPTSTTGTKHLKTSAPESDYPPPYRQRFQEAGLIGQVLYLEAEALGLRGTGIGCFFDDALHQMLGLPESATQAPLQSVYHFTVGVPLLDARIATEPPYAHLLPEERN